MRNTPPDLVPLYAECRYRPVTPGARAGRLRLTGDKFIICTLAVRLSGPRQQLSGNTELSRVFAVLERNKTPDILVKHVLVRIKDMIAKGIYMLATGMLTVPRPQGMLRTINSR
jgi:hypothetical protein